MRKVIFALAVVATIVSCQKKEDTDPIDVSKTTYLMDNSWQLKAYTIVDDVSDSSSLPIDRYTALDGCVKDNYLTFVSTSRVVEHEGDSKCVVSNPDSVTYGYTLTNNDLNFYMFTDPDSENHTTVYNGDMQYPSIDTFILTYRAPNLNDNTKTSEFVRTYVKIQ